MRKSTNIAVTKRSRTPVRWFVFLVASLAIVVTAWIWLQRLQHGEPNGVLSGSHDINGNPTSALDSSPVQPLSRPQRVLTPSSSNGTALRTLSSESFRARFNPHADRHEVQSVLTTLEDARRNLARRVMASALNPIKPPTLDVVIHDTTGEFVAATGQPWWAGAVTHDNIIELQPLEILRSRGTLQTTLWHEYAHTVIEALGRGRTPRWLAEGLAAHLAGEGPLLLEVEVKRKLTIDELEKALDHPATADEMRELYAMAYREVMAVIRAEGEAGVWKRIAEW